MSEQSSGKPDPAKSDTVEIGSDPLARETVPEDPDTGEVVTRPSRPYRSESVAEAGNVVGRFHILDLLGAGGMGVVFAAYDPQLDRKVAIKLLRTRGLTAVRREREATRLLAEARSMAQLSHPNVVTVYEAGTIEQQVFIAMEYVPGRTLRDWLAEQKRSKPEIVDAFIKAGRGLAAGHHAGLIHRDFKPENVLVGHDGRVRVIDFGLARPSRAAAETPTADGDEPNGNQSFAPSQLSTAGSLFGTPLYMAPEQHEKGDLDARTDQFAFCIALYEALHGTLPFPATSYSELASAVIEGRVTPPEPSPDIPARVVEALLRGLKPEPDDRWSSMDELLDELEPPVRRRRGLILAAAAITGVVAVAATLAVVKLTGNDPVAAIDPCAGGEQRLAGVWDADIKQRVNAAFRATKRTHAPDTIKRVDEELDRYAADWVAQRRQVCEATKVRGEQSEAAFDLRMQCFNDRLAELKATTKLFSTVDATTTDNAVSAALSLGLPSWCASLVPGKRPPPTAEQQRQIAQLGDARAELEALARAAQYKVLADKAQAHLARARAIGHAGTIADAMLSVVTSQLGTSKHADAEATIREALVYAARAKNDEVVASLWTYLIVAMAQYPTRYDDALLIRQVAEIAIERSDGTERKRDPRGDLEYAMGAAHLMKGEYQLAIKSYELARDLRVKSFGDRDTDTGKVYGSIGGAYLRLGNVFAAKAAFEKSLAITEQLNGPSHPDAAIPLGNLGSVAQAMTSWDDAITYHSRALKILEEIHGPDHEQVGTLHYSIGVSHNGKEDYAAAVPYYERALRIFEKLSPDHAYVGLSLVGLADCREEVGDAVRAIPEAERGLKLLTEAANKDGVQIALARYVLAKALWSGNRDRPRARALAAEARKGFQAGGVAALNGVMAVDKWFAEIDKR